MVSGCLRGLKSSQICRGRKPKTSWQPTHRISPLKPSVGVRQLLQVLASRTLEDLGRSWRHCRSIANVGESPSATQREICEVVAEVRAASNDNWRAIPILAAPFRTPVLFRFPNVPIGLKHLCEMRQPWALLKIPMRSYGNTDLWQVFQIPLVLQPLCPLLTPVVLKFLVLVVLLILCQGTPFVHPLYPLPDRAISFEWYIYIYIDVFLEISWKTPKSLLRFPTDPGASTLSGSVDHALRLWTLPLPCFGQIRRGAFLCFWFMICRNLWFVETGKGPKWDNPGQMQCKATCQHLPTPANTITTSTPITHWCELSVLRQLPQRDRLKLFGHSNPADYATLSIHPLYPCLCSSDEFLFHDVLTCFQNEARRVAALQTGWHRTLDPCQVREWKSMALCWPWRRDPKNTRSRKLSSSDSAPRWHRTSYIFPKALYNFYNFIMMFHHTSYTLLLRPMLHWIQHFLQEKGRISIGLCNVKGRRVDKFPSDFLDR